MFSTAAGCNASTWVPACVISIRYKSGSTYATSISRPTSCLQPSARGPQDNRYKRRRPPPRNRAHASGVVQSDARRGDPRRLRLARRHRRRVLARFLHARFAAAGVGVAGRTRMAGDVASLASVHVFVHPRQQFLVSDHRCARALLLRKLARARVGAGRFLFFFFASGLVAGLLSLALSPVLGSGLFYGMVGNLMSLVVAFAAMNPYATVLLYFFPVQARWLGLLAIAFELFGRAGMYGSPVKALIVVPVTAAFAYWFTVGRISLRPSRRGPSFKEQFDRWQQRRRMKQWQRRVSRADRPDDLFKNDK